MELRLSDGLQAFLPEEADFIVIAGIGRRGDRVYFRRRSLAEGNSARLVLQPMTRAEELRRFLAEHGFEILEERPVLSLGRPYSVLLTAYTGRQEAGGILFPYLGKLLQSPLTDKAERTAALAYLGKQLRHLQNLEKGARAGGEQEAQMEYCQAAEALRQLIREEFPNGSN